MIFFPYEKDGSNDYYPVVHFNISNEDRTYHVHCLIDSGASISIFNQEVAEILGIKIENGKKEYMGGVGGRIKGYIHEIEFEIIGEKIKAPVVFSREFLVSYNLLGREGVFPHFKILFDEEDLKVGIEPAGVAKR